VVDSTPIARLAHLQRFYDLIDVLRRRLGGERTLADVQACHDLPRRGVYFFFEQSEVRSDSGYGSRIVRVGTHALHAGSWSTLRQRLEQHRGTLADGGNHRGSIF
jgi:hypothetical protein